MNWRTPISVAVDRQYAESVLLPYTPFGARVHAIDTLIDEAANNVERELRAGDMMALAEHTGRLALLVAWKVTGELP